MHLRSPLRSISLVLAVTGLVVLRPIAAGAQPAAAGTAAPARLLDANTAAAVRRGLAFLAERQQEHGAFGPSGYPRANVGVCSLAAMAMMSAGSTPGRGPHGAHVRRFLDYVLDSAQDSGFIVVSGTSSHGPMYDHGFATLLLAECYGMSPRRDLRDKLARAVQLIQNSQNAEGGWRYPPQRGEADVSVTVCQVVALRAARNAGIAVPAETIDRAIAYIKDCQNPDGGFMYIRGGGESAFPRSAAAVVALHGAGIYDSPEVARARDYLAAFRPTPGVATRGSSHYFYGHYYAVQAMWHAPGERMWREWYAAVRDDLLAKQEPATGAWQDPIGREYATAMAVMILNMPETRLPIFERSKRSAN
jgi:hypothetical protein